MKGGNQSRLLVFWVAFSIAAVATLFAIFRLYRTARVEITAQREHALLQARTEIIARIQNVTEEVRHSTVKDLASFHVDGLAQTMQKWDDSTEAVIGIFRWDEAHGFSSDSIFPSHAPSREELVQLWQSFRAWRAAHSKSVGADGSKITHFQTALYSMLDNPAFPATELGYQSENLDILAHARRPTDPWAGWAARDDDPSQPWVFWYQGGPDDEIRGAFVDAKAIVQALRNQNVDTALAQFDLTPVSVKIPTGRAPVYAAELNELPGYRLTFNYGQLFEKKAVDARLAATVAIGLFSVFFLGGAWLALYTRREARDAERKVTFATQVSHELRTPLTSIKMYADLLAQSDVTEAKRVKFAQTIARESTRLESLVGRLLTFNALEKNGQKIACSAVDLGALVREAIEQMNSALQAANLTIETETPPEPLVADSDHSIVKQALLNLLDNACKYARGSGAVRIRLSTSRDRILLDVVDSGPGIPRAIRHRLFEPFVQGGNTLTDKSPGVGLGLSIARGTLRKIGGELQFLHTAQGATFQISLPAAKSAVPAS